MKYEAPLDYNEQQVDLILKQSDANSICRMLIGISLYNTNAIYVISVIDECLNMDDKDIICCCITSLSHVLRLHNHLSEEAKDKVIHAYERIIRISGVNKKVFFKLSNLLSDVSIYSTEIYSRLKSNNLEWFNSYENRSNMH